MAKRYYWLKLKEDFFRQKEIKKIRRIAGGDTYTIIYLKLMLLSLKNEGKLYFDGIEDTIAEEIALEIDEDPTSVQALLGILFSMNILQEIPEGVEIANIGNYIGSECDSAERVRRSRAKKLLDSNQESNNALQCNDRPLQSNNVVTLGNTDIEIELNKEQEKEKEKQQEKKKTVQTMLRAYAPVGSDLHNALESFIEMRNKMKKPLTERAFQLALNNLDRLSGNDEQTKIAIIDQSLEHGWQKFYELKAYSEHTSTHKTMQEEADDLTAFINSQNGGGYNASNDLF